MNAKLICHGLEMLRWIGVVVGFMVALTYGTDPQQQLHLLTPFVVISLAGLTGIESVFFGRTASEITGYTYSAYQHQSGINNISVAIVALLVFIFRWGTYAEAAVMSTLLIFLFLSACNHSWSAWKEHNRNIKNLLRPVMTIFLIAFVLPFIIRAIAHAK